MSGRKDTPNDNGPPSPPIPFPQYNSLVESRFEPFHDQTSQEWIPGHRLETPSLRPSPSNPYSQLGRSRAEPSLSSPGQHLPTPLAPEPLSLPEPTKLSDLEGGRARYDEKYEPPVDNNVNISEEFVDDSSSDDVQFGVKQAEAVAAAWSRKSLVVAYVGYA